MRITGPAHADEQEGPNAPRSTHARSRMHKVGVLSGALGLVSLLLPFASVSHSRVATGVRLWAWQVVGPVGMVALVTPWVLVFVAALADRHGTRLLAFLRGAAASTAVIVWLLVSGAAAGPAIAQVGRFARYSLGPAVWLVVAAASLLIVAARREVGAASPAGWVVTLTAPVGVGLAVATERLDMLGIMVEYHNLGSAYWPAVLEHLAYSAASIVVAVILGVSLGVFAYRHRRAARPIFSVLNGFQTIPGLALVGMLVVPLAALSRAVPVLRDLGVGGLGWAPLVIALTLYALLAIARNTFAGLESVPSATIEAGTGMGMSPAQVVGRVQMPLAAPIVVSGVRTASQQTIGNTTLGAFVAAGGLGPLVFLGLAQQANDLVLLGSISIVVLALMTDALMRVAEHFVVPSRLRRAAS